MGLHPEFKKGVIVVQNAEERMEVIELAGWPTPVNELGMRWVPDTPP